MLEKIDPVKTNTYNVPSLEVVISKINEIVDYLTGAPKEELIESIETKNRIIIAMAKEIAIARDRPGKEWNAQEVIDEYYRKYETERYKV